jgi:hypothetical protein
VGESSKMAMRGVCKRHTVEDPLHTLERDSARLPQDPDEVDAASNVFVTAERLPARGKGQAFPHTSQPHEPVRTLCHARGTGAKHVTAATQRPAVAAARRDRYVKTGYVPPG